MARILQAFTQLVQGLLLGVALSLPLHAQLDPRLQGSATDFLDLYQQASTLRAKPEIATIFDFSGSMQCLMYHPCYYNNDPNDNGDTSGITFVLTGGTNTFQVKVTVGDKSWGYTNGKLIRPDGSAVTEDLVKSTPTGGLYGDMAVTGASSQACDVRNWVRAASHVRLTKTIGSRVRTIDLPIPWKVIDPATTTEVPVKSLFVKDSYTYTDPATGLSTSGGTGSDIEIDTRYKIQTGFPDNDTRDNNLVLSGAPDQAVTKTKYMLRLSQLYIDWLFAGTYQNARSTENDYNTTLNGKYIVFDASDPTNVGLQTDAKQGQGFGSSWDSNAVTAAAQQANVLPARDRVQAVKEAAIRTWIKFQDRVFWAYRCLDDVVEAGNGTATQINGDSNTDKNNADATTTWVNGKDTGWRVLNGTSGSVPGMQRIAALFPYTNTPLCYATARTLAQFTQPANVFASVETGKDAPVACQNHFLIIFTDGVPTYDYNSENQAGSPYLAADGNSGSAQDGNTQLIGSNHTTTKAAAANMNPGNSWWNIFTFAGTAAHLADDSKTGLAAHPITDYMTPITSPTTPSAPSAFLPFAIKTRGAVDLSGVHRLVTTMTVGVSLGGHVSDAGSPKRRLFLAAAVGDPDRTYWDVNPNSATCLTPYTLKDPNNVSLGKTDNSTYFFDATSPDLLTKSLDAAFSEAAGSGNAGVTSNPNLPFIGASVSKQIYLGKFLPPKSGGVFWSGDLLMFPTKMDNQNRTVILDKSGKAITGTTKLDNTTATWSAANSLPLWSARHLKTRLPNTSSLSAFTYTDTALQNVVATDHATAYPAGSTAQQRLIKLVMGADTTNSNLPNRSNIMGDIIDSSPAYIEYNTSSLSGTFQTGERFRLILVGTNQGWLHAFGERTTISSVDDPDSTTTPKAKMDLVSGTVSELWAFMPTDFLANLDYLDKSTNTHKFMVDGSPSIYFLDLPPSSGGKGNGLLDGSNVDISSDPIGDTTHERAIAIIGLRKGGRSYYALNLHDPSAPTLQWSLVPDEATSTTLHSRNDTGLDDGVLATIIQNMGYSTSTPSFGRVLFNGVYKDVVFFGGGLSLPEIEAKFTGSPLMGRSVLALDVNNGHFLAVVDLTSNTIGGKTSGGAKTMIGPIATGVVPFEFFLGSGMAQRAYFTDLWGGLWCWGSKATVPDTYTAPATSPSAYRYFRKDTSDLQAWSYDGNKTKPYGSTGIRKVYQDENSSVTATALATTPVTYSYTFTGPTYTTLPSPFLVGTFPGKGHTDTIGTASAPVAVGIAMESGNRNDPLDYGTNPAPPPNTRLTVVFDRQDSRAWGLDTAAGPDAGITGTDKLLDAGKWNDLGAIGSTLSSSSASIRPGSSYYLAPASQDATMFGYYVTFPDKVADGSRYHYSKGINMPMAVAGSLFYSYFTPTTANVCLGGEGFTYSNKICDVMNPVVKDVGTGLVCTSGNVDKWVNVASDFSLLGAPGVQQAGTRSTTDANGNTTTTMDTNTYLGQSQARFPKARVWRTVR